MSLASPLLGAASADQPPHRGPWFPGAQTYLDQQRVQKGGEQLGLQLESVIEKVVGAPCAPMLRLSDPLG
eukprot:8250213-Pyramimonas_sp.AAC.1